MNAYLLCLSRCTYYTALLATAIRSAMQVFRKAINSGAFDVIALVVLYMFFIVEQKQFNLHARMFLP